MKHKNPARPPRAWWGKCVKGVKRSGGAYAPAKVCGALWHRKIGAPAKRRALQLENPAALIGTSPVLYTDNGVYHFPGGKLVIGRGSHDFAVIASRRLHRVPSVDSRVRRIDYNNNAKALKFYKRVGPFRHVFKEKPYIIAVIRSAGDRFTVYMRMNSQAWRKAQ